MAQIHIINLKDAESRKVFMIRQMKSLGLRYEFFEAIKGCTLTDDELSEKVDMTEVAKYPTWLTRNMLGAALSHMGVYKRIVNSGTDWHLILEDDVVLETNINQAINLISDNSEMFRTHLILFYGISLEGPVTLLKNPLLSDKNYNVHQVLSKDIGGAGAYMVHRDTARSLLEHNKIIKVAPDTWNFFREQGAISQIDCINPFVARPVFFESTIGYINPRTFLYKIKHLINRYKIPGLYQLLRRNRKKIWEKTSKVFFK